MGKQLIKLALRILMLNVVAVIIVSLFAGIQNNTVQICISAFFMAVLLLLVWLDASGAGQKSIHQDKILLKRKAEAEAAGTQAKAEKRLFRPWVGFAAGFISQLPTLLIVAAFYLVVTDIRYVLAPIANIMNMNYLYLTPMSGMPAGSDSAVLLQFFGKSLYIYALTSLAVVLTAGLAYLTGPVQDRKVEIIIERNKSKKATRVQDEWAKEKKAELRKRQAFKK